jgi:HK97 family phage portal protein
MPTFQTLGALAAHAGSASTVLDVVDPGVPLVDYDSGHAWDMSRVWRSQPSVRKVVSFIASNIASIPLHVYERAGDTDRRRVRDGDLAALIARPSHAPGMTPVRFWERCLTDVLLYDRRAIMVAEDGDRTELVRIPPRRFRLVTDGLDRVTAVRVTTGDGHTVDMDPAWFLLDVGYSQSHGRGTSPVETLTALLRETEEAVAYRSAMMRRSATHTGWVSRKEKWPSAQARANFLTSLRAFEAHAEREGGTLLLDEDMQWHDRTFKPTAGLDDLEARRLTDVEVAGAYHIPPELLGIREGNYSNLEAMRQSLYRDALGPYIAQWEQSLVPLTERLSGGSALYIEAHMDSKLRGSFEEAARVLQTSTGAPWLTRNEARARQNLPAVEGGDALVTPLNVLVGGQASPTDSGTQNLSAGPVPAVKGVRVEVKSADYSPQWEVQAEELLRSFFERQSRTVLSALGPKADWWDGERWDRELAADLTELAAEIVDATGRETAIALGFDHDAVWSLDRCRAYLRAVCKARAQWVNDATRRQIEDVLQAGEAPAQVFDRARSQRSVAAAGAFTAAMTGFAVIEAGKRAAPGRTSKTWVVNSSNPRPEHQALNGVTVPAGEDFPGGMSWPGDPAGGADMVAGCRCSVLLTHD